MVAKLIQTHPSIGLAPRLTGLGGMVSFQAKLIDGLEKRGVTFSFDLSDTSLAAILVVGGTRQVPELIKAHRRGIRIVQRLNGMNWMHRKRRTGWKSFLRAEGNNHLLAGIRRYLAGQIVYQSQFSQDWWERVFGKLSKPLRVTYNGVDLETYTDAGSQDRPSDHFRLLLVEGHIDQSNRQGLDHAIQLVQDLNERVHQAVELVVVGNVDPEIKDDFYASKENLKINNRASSAAVTWKGILRREQIPETDRSAHLLFSADLNAACPNSVIEALACGLPVIAFDTGALGELVKGEAGRIVPYGRNHWELEPPILEPLVQAAKQVLEENPRFRQAARRLAMDSFGVDQMVNSYLGALLG